MKHNALKAFYKSLQVNKQRIYCPRAGIYRIIKTKTDYCYDKLALISKCNWRTTEADEYQLDFEVEIQMESFKNCATPEQLSIINSGELIGKEIEVNISEECSTTRRLLIKWRFIPEVKPIDIINDKLKGNHLGNFEFDDETSGVEPDDDHDPLA